MVIKNSKLVINNLRCNIGQKKLGVNLGGDYIIKSMKNAKLIDSETDPDTHPHTLTDINSNTHIYNIEFLENDSSKLNGYTITYKFISELIDNNFCLNLGGDHSIGACTIQPLLDKYQDDLLVIWIDAHADVNTYETSPSQNKHGMPVATLLGEMEHWYKTWKPIQHHKLKPENLLYVGIRDLDPGEVNLINKLNIKYFKTFSDELVNWIQSHPASKIHISFDVDSIDPIYMPSTGTTAPEGLEVDDVIQIIKLSLDKLISLDVVEFNPSIGGLREQNTSLENIMKVITSIFN